jgi:beta-ribofuranosylaminobenzene 5'-phosphate synthase
MDATADTTAGGPVTVETGARLHFGFGNLSLAQERLYGAAGVTLADPTLRLTVEPSQSVESSHETATGDADHETVRQYAERACSLLGVPGVSVTVHETLPRHMGLGSGTQIALAVFAGVARAYGHEPQVRERAPELGRGGRSGIGVAAFERGGFLLDAGHPTERFTADRPEDGNWTVPSVVARHPIPDDWRFLVVIPDAEPGRAGEGEESSIRAVVESADPDVADRIAGVIARRLLPAVAEGALDRFGSAVREIGRLNGTWFADEQGGVYRPPVGDLVAELADAPAVAGVGQSSWGPAVYAVTDADRAAAARDAGRDALDSAGVGGDVRVVAGRNRGATVRRKRR